MYSLLSNQRKVSVKEFDKRLTQFDFKSIKKLGVKNWNGSDVMDQVKAGRRKSTGKRYKTIEDELIHRLQVWIDVCYVGQVGLNDNIKSPKIGNGVSNGDIKTSKLEKVKEFTNWTLTRNKTPQRNVIYRRAKSQIRELKNELEPKNEDQVWNYKNRESQEVKREYSRSVSTTDNPELSKFDMMYRSHSTIDIRDYNDNYSVINTQTPKLKNKKLNKFFTFHRKKNKSKSKEEKRHSSLFFWDNESFSDEEINEIMERENPIRPTIFDMDL